MYHKQIKWKDWLKYVWANGIRYINNPRNTHAHAIRDIFDCI